MPLRRLRDLLSRQTEVQQLLTAAGGTMGVRVVGSALSLGTDVLLARVLHANGYGTFVFCLAWAGFLWSLVDFGFPTLLVQRVAAYRTRGELGALRGLLQRTDQIAIGAAGIVTAAGAIAGMLLIESTIVKLTFFIGLVWVPAFAFFRLRRATILGLEYPITSQVIGFFVRPLVLWVIVGFMMLTGVLEVSAPSVMAAEVLAVSAALAIGWVVMRRRLPDGLHDTAPAFETRHWVMAAIPMFLLTHLDALNTRLDVIMVGSIAGMEESGFFDAARAWSGVVAYPILALHVALSPRVARLIAAADTTTLQHLVTRGARTALIAALPIWVVVIAAGPQLLQLYGEAFAVSYPAMAVLASGHLVTIALGPVLAILVMGGHARDVAWVLAASVVLNGAGNFLLIPAFGMLGAAISTALSTTLFTGVIAYRTRVRLGITPTAFHRPS